MNPDEEPTLYQTFHQSEPAETLYSPYTQMTIQQPPPPPVAPTVREDKHTSVNAKIEEGIDKEVLAYLAKANDMGTSAARVIKNNVVPVAFVLDIVSMVVRFSLVVMLVALPEIYYAIQGNEWWHDSLYGLSGIGIAVGCPIALFAAIWKYTSLREKRDLSLQVPQKKKRNELLRYYRGLLRSSVVLVWVAAGDAILMTIPYIFSLNENSNRARLLAEAIMLVVPVIASIVTMISERESRSDAQETTTAIGTAAAVGILKTAAGRLALHAGTFQDSTAVQLAMSGDLTAAIEAGVAERPDLQYMTLAEVARMLGYNDAKDDAIRRAFSRIAASAYSRGNAGVKRDPKKGYLVPEGSVLQLFQKYVRQAKGNVVKLPVATATKKTKRPGLLPRIWQALVGNGEEKEKAPVENGEKIVTLRNGGQVDTRSTNENDGARFDAR